LAFYEGAEKILAGANNHCIALAGFVNDIRRQHCCLSIHLYAFLINDYEKTNS
jgi:hypothetical protein